MFGLIGHLTNLEHAQSVADRMGYPEYAEKAALINILEVQPFGSFGRVYLGGEERDILAGSRAALAAIEQLQGMSPSGLEARE